MIKEESTESTESIESTATVVAKGTGEVAKKAQVEKGVKPKKGVVKGKKKETDVIVTTAVEVENLTKTKAFSLVLQLEDGNSFGTFKLGGVLSVIQANGWYVEEGFETFKEFVESKFGIGYRVAMYQISIYNGLVESGVKWAQVSGLGWTKLKEIANIITPDDVEEWVELALGMTTIQLQEYVKQKQAGTLPAGEQAEAPDISTLTYKVHSDQKEVIKSAVEKAKNEAETEFDAVALEAICIQYMNTGKKMIPAKKTLEDSMKSSTWEEVLEHFEQLWPEIELTVKV